MNILISIHASGGLESVGGGAVTAMVITYYTRRTQFAGHRWRWRRQRRWL